MLICVHSEHRGGSGDDTQHTCFFEKVAGKLVFPLLRYIAVHLLQYDQAHSHAARCANLHADGTVTYCSGFYANGQRFVCSAISSLTSLNSELET